MKKAAYSYETKTKIVDFWLHSSKSGKKISFKRMKHLWSLIQGESNLYQWKKLIDEGVCVCEYHKYLIFKTIKYRIHIIGGPRRMRIQKYVWEKFNEAREN